MAMPSFVVYKDQLDFDIDNKILFVSEKSKRDALRKHAIYIIHMHR